MLAYILRRLLLVIPTLFGIMVLNFFIVQAAPGGPVEQMIAQHRGHRGRRHRALLRQLLGRRADAAPAATTRTAATAPIAARAACRPELIQRIEKMYGFDKPIGERFLLMMKRLRRLRLRRQLLPQPPRRRPGDRQDAGVAVARPVDHAADLFRVDPARHPQGGARRLARSTSATSTVLIVLNAIPGFLFAVLLVVLFAGGSYFKWFPLRGLVSDDWSTLRRRAQGARLFLAHGAADRGHDDRRLRRASPS